MNAFLKHSVAKRSLQCLGLLCGVVLAVSQAYGQFLGGEGRGDFALGMAWSPPSQLTIATQPSATVQSDAVFAQQPTIQLRDASGNVVSQAGIAVTAAIASGDGVLGGTLTASTNTDGVAIFTDLTMTGPLGAHTLSFTSGTLAPASSATIMLIVDPALQADLDAAIAAAAVRAERHYTPESWAALAAALALPTNSQAEVVAKTTAINAAIAGLIRPVPAVGLWGLLIMALLIMALAGRVRYADRVI